MIIPDRLGKLLQEDQKLEGEVLITAANFGTWFADNKMPFFPGFTDHGIQHVESVMRAAEGLIREESWPLLTARDSAACIVSVLLHDSAMHLSEDGFLTLIGGLSGWRPQGDFYDEFDWRARWESFLNEAAHFDQKKLMAIFGKPEPVSRPPKDPGDWTEPHRLLIGEFVRRHHATLAHEIALAGVPGPGTHPLSMGLSTPWMRDFAGLLARSHNLDLRYCVEKLGKYGRRVWRGMHGPLLMALLRIGDYLEIQAPRAPHELLQVRSLRSPYSRQEWINHAAVLDVRPLEGDPEGLWVDAKPEDVKTFLALRGLFAAIQAEMDMTWAVLGEVYGEDAHLRNLGIRIRRIRSTLDNASEFGQKVGYVPVLAQFRTANSEILKLLVEPLYRDEPGYGVRELLQNAVDACVERDDYRKHNHVESAEFPDLPGDVVITLDETVEGNGVLTFEDSGIGMTKETVLDYFLTAGASFRRSDQWHKLHVAADG
ncbi:MAG TPA: hypothetical protein VGH38_36760, partial [Bryobacteraceae bacterium]